MTLALAVEPAVAATSPGINVLQNDARVDFPRSIDFHVVAESSGQITRATLVYRVGNENVFHRGDASVQPDAHIDAHYLIDLQRAYYPPGVTLHYQWQIKDLTGAEAQTAWSDLSLTDPRYRWHLRSQGNVQLRWHDVDDNYANAVLDTAFKTYSAGGTADNSPINIFIYGHLADFRGVLGVGSQEWVGGQTFPEYRVVLLLVDVNDVAGAQRSVAHEMTHLLLDSVAPGSAAPLPTWLDEGIAMVAEGQTQPIFQQALDQASRSHHLISIQSLSGNFPETPDEATIAYAESESMVRYFVTTYGQAKLGTLIASFRQGQSSDEAFKNSIGISSRDFQAAWQASLGVVAQTASAQPATSSGSTIVQTVMGPIRAVVAFVSQIIQSLQAPKLKTA
jgi:hypothetical protein